MSIVLPPIHIMSAVDLMDVVWPLHRAHYLTIADRELGESSPEVSGPPASDYRVIIRACDGEWRSVREIMVRIESLDMGTVSKQLKRAADRGDLDRKWMQFPWRTCWGYRRRL